MDIKTTKEAVQPASNGLSRFIYYLSKAVDPLVYAGTFIACVMLAGMMFLTFFDVFGRFVLNRPIIGSYEITEFMMVLLVSFGLGYCAMKKGHIRVDLILQYVSRKANQWFNIFTYGFSCILFAFVAWQGWLNAWNAVTTKAASVILLIPTFPFAFMLSVGAAFITLIFFRDFLKSIEEVIR